MNIVPVPTPLVIVGEDKLSPVPADVPLDRSGGYRAVVNAHAIRRYAERTGYWGDDLAETFEDVPDHEILPVLRACRIPVGAIKARLAYFGVACGASDMSPPAARATMPLPPADLAACFSRAFPEIPATAFKARVAARIIGDAKLLDRAKTECGTRAVAWIEGVHREYAR